MGNKISFLRRAKGIKQYDLAKSLDVSPSFLCKIEKGLIEPTEAFKKKCSAFFNEKEDALFNLSEEKKGVILHENEANNNLWSIRIRKNLKQNKLAELIGCSPSYLSKIEKGFQEPNIAFKKKCAKILRIKEIELFPENKII